MKPMYKQFALVCKLQSILQEWELVRVVNTGYTTGCSFPPSLPPSLPVWLISNGSLFHKKSLNIGFSFLQNYP